MPFSKLSIKLTSRRPVSSEKSDQLETTASDTQSEPMHTCPLHVTPEKAGQIASTPLSRMNECCIQTLMASRQLLERESRITGTFFSPLVTSPPLAQHDESSEASYTSPDCGKTGESLQGTRLQTPRAVLWTPKHSPALCMNGTPVSQPKFVSNQKVSEPSCCARATRTDDMPFLQAPLQSTRTEDSHVSQQVQAPTVDAMCQTDYEDACERPRPVPNELPKNSVAEHVVDGTTLMDVGYQAETLLKPAGVQITGSCCNVLERPQVADAAILCCMYSEQLVEYGIQAEPCHTEFRAAEPTKQEAVCEPVVLSDQVPLMKSCSVQACGVQTCIVAKDCESQVNVSLAEDYRTDLEIQTVVPNGTCSNVEAIPDMKDYASQVSTSLVEKYKNDIETQTVMPGSTCSGVQVILDVVDYASQVNTSLVEEYRKDFETQTVMPESSCCGVQAIPVVEDCASQVNKSLIEDYRTDFGVQVMAEVLSCASQVDLQLTRPKATDCAIQCELLVQNSEKDTPASNVVDCGVQATLLVQECTTQTQQCLLHCNLKESGVQVMPSVQDSTTQNECFIGDMSKCSVQTTPRSFSDSSTQPDCHIPLASSVQCRVQDVPMSTSSVSQAKVSAKSRDKSASKSSKCSFAKDGSSQFSAFSVRNILAGKPGSSVPPDVPKPITASGSARHQQFGQPGRDILAALRASQRKFNEEEGRASLPAGQPKAADYTPPGPLTTASGTKTWCRQSEMLKKSAAVQADIWNTREMSLMEHRMDQYKKELQQRESEYKLQEKAAKKREIQLKAVIRQLKNKDKDLIGFEALEEEVQIAQRRASLSFKTQQLASAQRRQQAWAKLSSHPAGAEPRSPLREVNQEVPQTRSPRTPRTPKDDTLGDTEYIPPMKFILDDLENLGSPL
ncbi:uncharacterized protein LOC142761651 [Rhipicephalus microplus]|uniref:uncharacterized protein LOC142761651 n=1 Tax=Rhipicephalus microplus TaxID=6941 RepID=UPI003F6D2207